MKLAFLQDVYERPGPFATVYLDTSADAEDASKAIELRWRSAREGLAEQGADEADLDAIADVLARHRTETGPRGQVVVAERGQVAFSDELPQPPDLPMDQQTHVGRLPHLMPYLRQQRSRIPHVVAVIDHLGADITVAQPTGNTETTTVEGDDHPVHKAHAGRDESHQKFHHAVEEQWKHNASLIAEEITAHAMRIDAKMILLAGDVQQRKLVQDKLGKSVQGSVVETEASHRDRKASIENLRDEIDKTIDATVRSRTEEAVQEYRQERGQHDRAVEGWQGTLEALQNDQVRTLLWTRPDSGERSQDLAIGRAASEVAIDARDLDAIGAESVGTVPASAAVIRAVAGSNAELITTDSAAVELADGIGAILRYSQSGPNT